MGESVALDWLTVDDFTTDWAAVEEQITHYCRRRLGRSQSADEVVQDVRIRAWRGYASFQRRSTFLTWSLTIARREVDRHLGRRQPFVSIDSVPEPAAPPPEAEASSRQGVMTGRIAAAVAAKALSERKAIVLRRR